MCIFEQNTRKRTDELHQKEEETVGETGHTIKVFKMFNTATAYAKKMQTPVKTAVLEVLEISRSNFEDEKSIPTKLLKYICKFWMQ